MTTMETMGGPGARQSRTGFIPYLRGVGAARLVERDESRSILGRAPAAAALAVFLFVFLLGADRMKAGTVAAFGDNTFGQAVVPAELTGALAGVIAVDAGREHSVALLTDGTVRAWGYSGDNRSSPPAGLSNVIAVEAGSFHTLALKADGTVNGWGFNGAGILTVPEGLTNVVAVAAGEYHSLALRGDGVVVGWGFNGNGRATAPAVLTDVVAIDAGRDHSLALRSDGTVVAWGLNNDGQANTPAGLSGVVAIAAGDFHNLALKGDGTVVAWGRNHNGQSSPPGGLTGVRSVAAGGYHSLALRSDGTVAVWGDNSSGQLELASSSNVTALSGGGQHSLALLGSGLNFAMHPSSQSVLAGSDVVFSVAVDAGSAVGIQWRFNGMEIPGAVDSELRLNGVGRGNAGIYSAAISTADGLTTSLSQNAILVVRALHQLAPVEFLPDGGLRLRFGDRHGIPLESADLLRYAVQQSPDLSEWTIVEGAARLENGSILLDLPGAGYSPRMFFRIVETPAAGF